MFLSWLIRVPIIDQQLKSFKIWPISIVFAEPEVSGLSGVPIKSVFQKESRKLIILPSEKRKITLEPSTYQTK